MHFATGWNLSKPCDLYVEKHKCVLNILGNVGWAPNSYAVTRGRLAMPRNN